MTSQLAKSLWPEHVNRFFSLKRPQRRNRVPQLTSGIRFAAQRPVFRAFIRTRLGPGAVGAADRGAGPRVGLDFQ